MSNPTQTRADLPENARNLAMLCWAVSFVGVIPFGNVIATFLMWYFFKSKHNHIDQHGKMAFNFNLSLALGTIVASAIFGVLVLPIVGIFMIVVNVLGIVKAYQGQIFKAPLTFNFLK